MVRTSFRLALALLPGLAAALDVHPSLTVDPFVRSSVEAYDTTVYPASNGILMNWTGDVSICLVGTENQDFINAGILRVNYYRRLVGLPDVIEDAAASNEARAAALMMDANNSISHDPPIGWSCYTPTGATAAFNSNLAYTDPGPWASGEAIDSYINDAPPGNEAAGHRRWILFPELAQVGHGDTAQANALWVSDTTMHPAIWGARPATPKAIAWPYAGYFPVARLPGSTRWSYSINANPRVAGAPSFASTTIAVRDGAGTLLATTKEAIAPTLPGEYIGDNTVVWRTAGVNTGSPGTADRPYHVLLRGIANVTGRTATHYTVVLVDTTQTRADEARPTATVAATTGTAVEGALNGVFTVTLSAPAARDTWVNYSLAGTASTPDFNLSGAITIPTGATTGTLTITALSDGFTESGETVFITLDPGCAYVVGATSTATVTIADPGAGPNSPPVITEGATDSLTIDEDTDGARTLHATDPDLGAVLTWSVAAENLGTVTLSGTGGARTATFHPDANVNGTGSFVIRVTDEDGATDEITVTVTITPINDQPAATGPLPAATAVAGVPFTYVVPIGAIVDADGDPLVWTSNESLLWLTFDPATRTFSGTPALTDVDSVYISVTASDPEPLSDGVLLALTVLATPDITPPATPAAPFTSSTLSPLPTLSGVTETGAIVTIYDNGVPIDTVVAAIGGGWTWTPAAPLSAGPHNMTVTATDASGNTSLMSPATTITVAGSGGIASGGGEAAGSPACGAGTLSALLLALFTVGRLRRRRA